MTLGIYDAGAEGAALRKLNPSQPTLVSHTRTNSVVFQRRIMDLVGCMGFTQFSSDDAFSDLDTENA